MTIALVNTAYTLADGIIDVIYAGQIIPSGAVIYEPLSQDLDSAIKIQIAAMNAAYQSAITAPVSFTTVGGITAHFGQAVTDKQNLQNAIDGSMASGVWSLNLWLDVNGLPITPFTHADLLGLAEAFANFDSPEFTHLLSKINAIHTAAAAPGATVASIQSIIW